MTKSNNVHITTDLKNPTTEGVHHRLLCMTGPRKGTVIYLTGKRIILGRGEEGDIQITDPKISREHAEFMLANGKYTLTDLNTPNGIIVNDTKEKQKTLEDGYKIVIGQTVLKYNVITVSQSVTVYDEKNKNSSGKKHGKPSAKKVEVEEENAAETTAKPKKNALILILVLAAVVYLLMGGNDTPPSSTKQNATGGNSFDMEEQFAASSRRTSKSEDKETKIKVESLIHRGRREYREGNYFRAMEDFRLSLTLEPGNATASFYMSKSRQRLDEEVNKFFFKAKQDKEAKKFSSAMVSYASILRLLKGYPNDERFQKAYCQLSDMLKSDSSNEKYLDADTKIDELHTELGLKKDEVKCKKE